MIAIIDYNAGNLKSVEKALHFLRQRDSLLRKVIHFIENPAIPAVGFSSGSH